MRTATLRRGPPFPVGLVLLSIASVVTGCRAPRLASGSGATSEGGQSAGSSASRASCPQLEDQHGVVCDLAPAWHGRSIVIAGDADAADSMTAWDLDVVTPSIATGIEVFRVVDLRGISRLVAPIVRARLRSGAKPPGTRILLDWNGEVARRFACRTGEATVIVVADGSEVARAAGPVERESAHRIARAVTGLVALDSPLKESFGAETAPFGSPLGCQNSTKHQKASP